MIRNRLQRTVDRLRAADPGHVRARLALSAVLSIVLAAGSLALAGVPLTVLLIGAVAGMMATFTVNDPEPKQQAVTLLLGFVVGGTALAAASIGRGIPPADGVVFVLLIFVAVYAQRFGSRGIALGSMAFFLFFLSMFLQTRLGQVPALLAALATGLAANALVRFVLLRRRPERELLSLRRAFRARLSAVVLAAEHELASGGSGRSGRQLRRANTRLHECVLLIEDTAGDVLDARSAATLRRRVIEVELAVQWLSITARRTSAQSVEPQVTADLLDRLRRFRALVERDPRELPVIAGTEEFSRVLVAGSRPPERAEPGDELRRAIAELAVADVNAQRTAEQENPDDSDETTEQPSGEEEQQERIRLLAFDNHTRSALQAVVGGGLAVVGGELVSTQRWYWAVLTVFVVFLGTTSAGATFVKGARRVSGTLFGILGGVGAALLVGGNTVGTIVLVLVCVFAMVHVARVSQFAMAFFVTTLLGLVLRPARHVQPGRVGAPAGRDRGRRGGRPRRGARGGACAHPHRAARRGRDRIGGAASAPGPGRDPADRTGERQRAGAVAAAGPRGGSGAEDRRAAHPPGQPPCGPPGLRRLRRVDAGDHRVPRPARGGPRRAGPARPRRAATRTRGAHPRQPRRARRGGARAGGHGRPASARRREEPGRA